MSCEKEGKVLQKQEGIISHKTVHNDVTCLCIALLHIIRVAL